MGNNLELGSQQKLCKTVRLCIVQEIIKEAEGGFRKTCLVKGYWGYNEKGHMPRLCMYWEGQRKPAHKVTGIALGKYKLHALQRTQTRWGSSIYPDPLLLFVSSAFWAMIQQCLCWTPNSIKEGFRYCLPIDVPQTGKNTSDDLFTTSYLTGKC